MIIIYMYINQKRGFWHTCKKASYCFYYKKTSNTNKPHLRPRLQWTKGQGGNKLYFFLNNSLRKLVDHLSQAKTRPLLAGKFYNTHLYGWRHSWNSIYNTMNDVTHSTFFSMAITMFGHMTLCKPITVQDFIQVGYKIFYK